MDNIENLLTKELAEMLQEIKKLLEFLEAEKDGVLKEKNE